MLDFLTPDMIAMLVSTGSILIGMYAGFKARMSVLEKAVTDLEGLVSEMRQDIKTLIASKVVEISNKS